VIDASHYTKSPTWVAWNRYGTAGALETAVISVKTIFRRRLGELPSFEAPGVAPHAQCFGRGTHKSGRDSDPMVRPCVEVSRDLPYTAASESP
jgi:hypothetical protein